MHYPANIQHNQALFCGTGVALATPFTTEGDIDYPSFERLLERVLEANVENLILFGTTGESPTITPKERIEATKFVINRVKSTTTNLVVGMASNNTALLVDLIKQSNFEGIDGLLSSTPFYNKPSQEGLFQHFSAIAEVSPVPIIVYNIPGRTGCDLLPNTLLKLRNKYPTKIVAVKESSGKVERVKELVTMLDNKFTVLSGDDCHTLEFLKVGAKGAVSVVANAFPNVVKNIIDEVLQNVESIPEHALQLDEDCCELYHVLFEDGNPAGIKALLKRIGVIENDTLRLPLVPICTETQKHLNKVVDALHSCGYC